MSKDVTLFWDLCKIKPLAAGEWLRNVGDDGYT